MKKATPVQINWKPDKNNPVPLYQQIVDYIYQKISSGDWLAVSAHTGRAV